VEVTHGHSDLECHNESLRSAVGTVTCLSVILAVASSTIREGRLVHFYIEIFASHAPLSAKAVRFVAKPLQLAEILQWLNSGDKLGV
jgi:hypothetical protein